MKEMAVMGAGTEAFRDVAVASISCRGHWRGCWVTWTGLETGEVKATEERSGGRRGDSQTDRDAGEADAVESGKNTTRQCGFLMERERRLPWKVPFVPSLITK
jgi:hypothetical protein